MAMAAEKIFGRSQASYAVRAAFGIATLFGSQAAMAQTAPVAPAPRASTQAGLRLAPFVGVTPLRLAYNYATSTIRPRFFEIYSKIQDPAQKQETLTRYITFERNLMNAIEDFERVVVTPEKAIKMLERYNQLKPEDMDFFKSKLEEFGRTQPPEDAVIRAHLAMAARRDGTMLPPTYGAIAIYFRSGIYQQEAGALTPQEQRRTRYPGRATRIDYLEQNNGLNLLFPVYLTQRQRLIDELNRMADDLKRGAQTNAPYLLQNP